MYDEYVQKYSRVAILFQNGIFFEIYGNGEHGNAKELALALNIELVQRADQTLVAGFPLTSLDKNMARLVDDGYAVVMVEQCGSSSSPSSRKVRKVTRVTSRGTFLEGNMCTTHIMCLYCKEHNPKPYATFSFGFAVCDVTVSNKVYYGEVLSPTMTARNNPNPSFDDVIRLVAQYAPVECVLVTDTGVVPKLSKHFGLRCPVRARVCPRNITRHYGQFGSIAVAALESYLEEHDPALSRLQPVPYGGCRDGTGHEFMDLCSNALLQLDVPLLHSRKEFNMTVTPMGNRLLYQRMAMPVLNPTELERRYNMIESFNDDDLHQVRNVLKQLPDLAKFHRRLVSGTLKWDRFRILDLAYKSLLMHTVNNFERSEEMKKTLTTIMCGYTAMVDTGKWEYQELFRRGIYDDVDELVERRRVLCEQVDGFKACITKVLPKTEKDKLVVKDGGILLTSTRAEALLRHPTSKIAPLWRKAAKVTGSRGNCVVLTDELFAVVNELGIIESDLAGLIDSRFAELQKEFAQKVQMELDCLTEIVAELDVSQSVRSTSKKRRFCRPQLREISAGDDEKNGITAVNLSNYLVEIINPETKYVENDITLDDGNGRGMLIYGVNACGKTCLLKSLGVAVILAQAGLFVPAESFSLTPLRRLITRIAGGDNIERSQSSFVVELEELRTIMVKADASTLILGDEMCRGTEIESANALVGGTLEWLDRHRTYFLTATHLHEVGKVVKETLKGVQVCHMDAKFDDVLGVVYSRKLQPGQGMAMYGLEIARHMGFPQEFLDICMGKRKRSPESPPIKRSRYNNRKLLLDCERCGYVPEGENMMPLDTHHVNFQCEADAHQFHDGQNVHALHNLIALCKRCHQLVHAGKLHIQQLQGLNGMRNIFTEVSGKK